MTRDEKSRSDQYSIFVYALYYQHTFTAFLLRICYHAPSAVETRKYIYTIQTDEVVSLCDGRLERKSSELHLSRNGKEDQAYLSEKSTFQCLDVKVVRSKYEDTK